MVMYFSAFSVTSEETFGLDLLSLSMEDAGASKLHGIKKIVRLKEMFQKWQNVTLGSKDSNNHSDPSMLGPELRRFIIPTSYLSHTLFKVLLEKVAEEFGWKHRNGGRTINYSDLNRGTIIVLVSSVREVSHSSIFLVLISYMNNDRTPPTRKIFYALFAYRIVVKHQCTCTSPTYSNRNFLTFNEPLSAKLRGVKMCAYFLG
ncbi:Auxin-induced protein 6B [Glycine soja]